MLDLVRLCLRLACASVVLHGCGGTVFADDHSSSSATGAGTGGTTAPAAAATATTGGATTSSGAATTSGDGGADAVGGADGAEGAPGVGGSGAGGAAGSGGAGAGGELPAGPCAEEPEEYEPVPGCERLVWAGDFVLVDDGFNLTPRIARLDDGDVGLLHVVGSEGPTVTRRVEDPFGSWPPVVGEPATILEQHSTSYVPDFSARGDGTFAVHTSGTAAIGTFGVPGALLSVDGGRVELDPRAGEGGFILDVFGAEIAWVPSLDPGREPVVVHTGDRACLAPSGFVKPTGELLMAYGRHPYYSPECQLPSQAPLLRVSREGSTELPALELGAPTFRAQLVEREGGAWLVAFVDTDTHRVCAIPVHESGLQAGPAFRGTYATLPTRAARWRRGFAWPTHSDSRFAVSDGTSLTLSEPTDRRIHWSAGFPPEIAASQDGASLVVAFGGYVEGNGDGLLLGRLDCAPAD